MFKKSIFLSAGIILTSTQAFSAQGLNVMAGQNLSATAGTIYNLQAGNSGIFQIQGGHLSIEDNVTITTVGTTGMYNNAAALLVTNDSGRISGGNGAVIIADAAKSGLLFNLNARNSLVELGNDVNITTAKGVGIFFSGSNDSHVSINDGFVLNSDYIGVATAATDKGAQLNLNSNAKINATINAFNISGSNGSFYIGQGSVIKAGFYAFNLSGIGNSIDVNGSTVEGGSRGVLISGENHEVNINSSKFVIGGSVNDPDRSVVVLGGKNNIVNINDSFLLSNGNQAIRFGNSGTNTSQDGVVINIKNTEITKAYNNDGDYSAFVKLTNYNNEVRNSLYSYALNLDNSTINLESADLIYSIINPNDDASVSNGSKALININNVRVGGSDNAYLVQFGSVTSTLSETDLVLNLSGTDATTFTKGILNNDQSKLELNLINSKINGDVVNSASSQGEMLINATDGSSFTGNVYALNENSSINASAAYTSVSLNNSVWNLNGDSHVVSLTNGGIVNFIPSSTPGVLLTVHGNYQGNNGLLSLNTQLGDDNSLTDKLIVEGNASGNTRVQIINVGGSGAQTQNGIQIIKVSGASPADAFSLKGDYVTEAGQQAVIAGAYAYTLQHGGAQTSGDGHWYLVSSMTPQPSKRYHPAAPLYEQYGQVLAELNTLPTLQQRVGNTYWQQNAASQAPNNYGMWGRIVGTRTGHDPARSTTYAGRDTDLWKMQAGFDFVIRQNQDGLLVTGVNISHGTASSNISSPYGRGKVDATGTGIGASLSWLNSTGFYVDTQAQAMFFDSDVSSTTIGRKMVKGNSGYGLALSGEAGWRYQVGNGFSVTPQAQLIWSRVDFDNFIDPYGTSVSLRDGDSLRARLGVSLDYTKEWKASNGTKNKAHVYAIANLYNEFLNGSETRLDDFHFKTRNERLWAGIGLGGTYEWQDGRYALFGSADLAGATNSMSDNYALSGTLGFRVKW